MQKSLRDQLMTTQTEIESLKADCKASVEKEKLMSSSIEEYRDKIKVLTVNLEKEVKLNESLKSRNTKVNSDLFQKNKLIQDMLNQIKAMNENNKKLEDDYKLKKKALEDLQLKSEQSERIRAQAIFKSLFK